MQSALKQRFPTLFQALRSLVKPAQKLAIDGRLRLLSLFRAIEPLRARLRLPRNGFILSAQLQSDEGSAQELRAPRDFERGGLVFPYETSFPADLESFRRGRYEPGTLTRLTRPRFWSSYGGTVLSSRGRLIGDLSKDPWGLYRHRVHLKASLPQARPLKGRTLSLVTPEAPNNYHHWIVDLLPRLGLLQAAGLRPADFDQILIKYAERPYQVDTLRLLGVPLERLIAVDEDSWYEPEELVVPSIRDNNSLVPPEDLHFVRRSILGAQDAAPPTRRLYVSRSDAGFRKVLNEEAVYALLKPLGFEFIVMSQLNVLQQARLFSQAAVIVSPSSAAMANLCFASPGCRVIELLAPRWIVPYTWIFTDAMQIPLTCLIGAGPRTEAGRLPQGVRDDIQVDLGQLEAEARRVLAL